jgi:hypothetical protein
MHKNSLVALLCALVLGACATLEPVKIIKLEERKNPPVTVSGNTIQVPEILYFLPDEKNIQVMWHLPEGQGLMFPENGIQIDGALTDKILRDDRGNVAVVLDRNQTEIQCDKQRGGTTFTCTNRNSKPGIYKYTVRVLRNGELLPPRDPAMMNMP